MIEFEGLKELEDRLDSLASPQKIETALGKGCMVVESDAKQNAPKDTGALRRSITSEVRTEGDEVVGVVYTPLEYAPYVEYGTGLFAENGGRSDVPWNYQDDAGNWHTTSGQKPQPFMRPALDNNKDEVLKFIKEALLNG